MWMLDVEETRSWLPPGTTSQPRRNLEEAKANITGNADQAVNALSGRTDFVIENFWHATWVTGCKRCSSQRPTPPAAQA